MEGAADVIYRPQRYIDTQLLFILGIKGSSDASIFLSGGSASRSKIQEPIMTVIDTECKSPGWTLDFEGWKGGGG